MLAARRRAISVLATVLSATLIAAGASLPSLPQARASGNGLPLCALSTSALQLIESESSRLGVAVIDLDSGLEWTGGDSGVFALHSVVKVPIAWLALTQLAEVTEPDATHTRLRREIGMMVTHSANDPVAGILRYVGGLTALGEYYEQLGVPELRTGLHAQRWGIGTARPLAVARMFGGLAVSASNEEVREHMFQLLSRTPTQLRWGATRPPETLEGWVSLVKTGQFLWSEEELRLNSAAIWLDADQRPRYVIVMMLSGKLDYGRGQALQNRIGAALGHALAERERTPDGERWNCLKLSLDLLVARYF